MYRPGSPNNIFGTVSRRDQSKGHLASRIERFERKLVGWKMACLSKGERLTLLKSTLSNLLVYYMYLFPIPKSIAKKSEAIQARFLWEDSEISPGEWEAMKQLKERGGLGIKSLIHFNEALLGKRL